MGGMGPEGPTLPGRNTLHRLLFAIANLVWLSLIGGLISLSEAAPIDVGDLACFWVIMIPSIGFAIVMAHLMDQKRNRRILEEQKLRGKGKPETED